VLTMAGARAAARGQKACELGAIDSADVLVEGDVIASVEPTGGALAGARADRVFEASGRVLMPGFVDCHTHACWAGSRLDEWERKLRGATYLELLEAGGGIMSTVRAVRAASREELRAALVGRLNAMLREGATTVEVKSGYGLTTADELKMLRAIADAGADWLGTVVPTACIGHAIDREQDEFVARTIEETLPAVHEEFPGVAIDAYCEHGAWSLDECLRLFDRALDSGHPVRVHADQFHSLGMIPEAVRRGFRSVDHLEATTPDDRKLLAESETFGVMLPCSGFHVDGRYGDGRSFLDAGGTLAIATNYNPGSAPCPSVPMAVALACRQCGLRPDEALVAATRSAADVLGFQDRGVLRPGARADLVLLRHTDERDLAFEFGGNPVDLVIAGGRIESVNGNGSPSHPRGASAERGSN